MENIYQAIAENAELRTKLGSMWKAGAKSEDLAQELSEAGIETTVDNIETALSAAQAKRAELIGAQELDMESLEMVAGGGSGLSCDNADDCDKRYQECSSGFFKPEDRCSYDSYCDEYTGGQICSRNYKECGYQEMENIK